MKNTLLIITALLFVFESQAQLGKGRMMISGNFNFSKGNTTSNDSLQSNSQPSNSLNITLRYGYFITNKIMVGVYGGSQNGKTSSNLFYYDGPNYTVNTNENTTKNFSGGIFSRYYQLLGKSRFALFGQLSAGYGKGKQTQKTASHSNTGDSYSSYHSDFSFVNVGFNPGLVFFVTKNIAIETTFGNIGYNAQRSKNYNNSSSNTSETKSSSFNTNLAFSLSSLTWGVNFYFGGKKNKTADLQNENK